MPEKIVDLDRRERNYEWKVMKGENHRVIEAVRDTTEGIFSRIRSTLFERWGDSHLLRATLRGLEPLN